MRLSSPLGAATVALGAAAMVLGFSAAANCSENTCLLRLRGALFIRNTSVGAFCRAFAEDRQRSAQLLAPGGPCGSDWPGAAFANVAAACACADEARVKYPPAVAAGLGDESRRFDASGQRVLG